MAMSIPSVVFFRFAPIFGGTPRAHASDLLLLGLSGDRRVL